MNKNRIKIIVINLCLLTQLSAVDWQYWKDTGKKPLDWIEYLANTQAWERTKYLSRKPVTYLALGGALYAGHKLGNLVDSQKIGIGSVLGAFFGLQLMRLPQWIKLRSQLIELRKEKTSDMDPAVRNVWKDPMSTQSHSFLNGYLIMQKFHKGSNAEKQLMKRSFMSQMGAHDDTAAITLLDVALKKVEADLKELRQYTNFQYVIAKSMGLTAPDELLTGDTLINTDIDEAWRQAFDRSVELNIYSIGLEWSDSYSVGYPTYYTWVYPIASQCVRLLLRQYSFLKAIRRIMESVIDDNKVGPFEVYLSK